MVTTTTRTQPTTILPLNTQAPHYKWLVASIVLLANGTQTFGGGSGINIVMPRLMAAFGADLATAQWVVTGFFLTRVLVTPLLGVTLTSVIFERRRASYQLAAYYTYDSASLAHRDTLGDLRRLLHQAGIMGAVADRAALSTIRRQLDIEAIAVGFQSSFLLACLCFVLASLPMVYLFLRQGWKR